MAMDLNDVGVQVFGHTWPHDPIPDVRGDFRRIQGIRFSTGYPGGLYLSASMYVPKDIVESWLLRGAQRLRIVNGDAVVFEGQISNLDRAIRTGEQGIAIDVVGYFAGLLASRRLGRLYADKRTSPDVWRWTTGSDAHAEQTTISRYNEDLGSNMLRMVPDVGVTWGTNDRARLTYSAPAGEEIRRMDFDFNFNEGGQNWSTKIQALPSEAELFYRDSNDSGAAQSVEPAAGVTGLNLFITSLASQTVPAAATVHAEYSKIVVYATMNHTPSGGKNVVNLTEIVKDIRGELSDLSADVDLIGSNTLSLVPFISQRYPSMADILSRASAYGDASFNRWAVGVLGSHLASDNKPKIFAEQYPVLTAGYDYMVSLRDPNLVANMELSEGYITADENSVWNWIIVEYMDDQGFSAFVTPIDDANLKNQASIDAYGQRDMRLSIGPASESLAIGHGRRFLSIRKDPQWSLKGPIAVKGWIHNAKRLKIPAARIQAGQRLLLRDFVRDPATGTSDLVFLITKTDYSDEDRVCSMTVGVPNSLDVYLAQRELVDERLLG